MRIFAITRTREEASQLIKLTGMTWSYTSPSGWTQKHADFSPGVNWGIEWWKDEQPPVPNKKWRMRCYWQGDRDFDAFFLYIQQEEAKLKATHIANFAKLKELFPVLDWELDEEELFFSVRVKTEYGGGSGASPVSLKDDDFEAMETWLSTKAWKKETKSQLRDKYPFLFFAPDSDPNSTEVSPGMQAVIGAGMMWKVFLASFNEYTNEDYCSTSTGYYFEWPIIEEAHKKIAILNQESEKSRQGDWFFCTVCQVAKPRSEYGYYYFAETRCKDCLEPAWEKRARAETYN